MHAQQRGIVDRLGGRPTHSHLLVLNARNLSPRLSVPGYRSAPEGCDEPAQGLKVTARAMPIPTHISLCRQQAK